MYIDKNQLDEHIPVWQVDPYFIAGKVTLRILVGEQTRVYSFLIYWLFVCFVLSPTFDCYEFIALTLQSDWFNNSDLIIVNMMLTLFSVFHGNLFVCSFRLVGF